MTGDPRYNALMEEVCVRLGWCGSLVNDEPSHVDDFIPTSGPVSASQFVDWLFLADGVDPTSEPSKWGKHKGRLREAFRRHMGADTVDASVLKWDVG